MPSCFSPYVLIMEIRIHVKSCSNQRRLSSACSEKVAQDTRERAESLLGTRLDSPFAMQYINRTLRMEGETMAISKELLDILACPKCKGEIYLNEAGDGLICDDCKLLYEIKDDIPIMLIDEAKSLEES